MSDNQFFVQRKTNTPSRGNRKHLFNISSSSSFSLNFFPFCSPFCRRELWVRFRFWSFYTHWRIFRLIILPGGQLCVFVCVGGGGGAITPPPPLTLAISHKAAWDTIIKFKLPSYQYTPFLYDVGGKGNIYVRTLRFYLMFSQFANIV